MHERKDLPPFARKGAEFLRQNPGEIAAFVLLAVSLVLYPVVPIFLWLTPAALAAAHLARRTARLSPSERRWILFCCMAALAIQVGVLAVFGYHDPTRSAVKLDDYGYLESSKAIAKAWAKGFYPALSLKGSPPYLGTLHTGYERLLGLLFLIFGPSVKVGIAANALAVALLPLLAFLLAQSLFGPSGNGTLTSDANGRSFWAWLRSPWKGAQPAKPSAAPNAAASNAAALASPAQEALASPYVWRAAALLIALHPSYAYWSTWLLKDVILAVCFAVALLLLVDLLRRPSLLCGVAFGGTFLFLTILRAYAGLSLLAGVALLILAWLPRRVALWGFLYLAAALWALSYSESFGHYFSQLTHSLGTMLPLEAQTYGGSFRYFARGVPRLVLAPYAWVKAFGTAPQYGLYPGMWYLYLIVYPLCLSGFARAMRHNHLLSTIPVACLAFSGLIFLMAYGGDSSRQRLWLELLLVLYAALGLNARRRWVLAVGWYVLLFAFAAVQLATLGKRYG